MRSAATSEAPRFESPYATARAYDSLDRGSGGDLVDEHAAPLNASSMAASPAGGGASFMSASAVAESAVDWNDVDLDGAHVLEVSPAVGATGVRVGASVSVRLGGDLLVLDPAHALQVYRVDGSKTVLDGTTRRVLVGGVSHLDSTTNTITFAPFEAFAPGEQVGLVACWMDCWIVGIVGLLDILDIVGLLRLKFARGLQVIDR